MGEVEESAYATPAVRFRFVRDDVNPGHVRGRLFAGEHEQSMGLAGTLTLRVAEAEAFEALLDAATAPRSGWTSHGHSYGPAPDQTQQPRMVARCGGPGLCSKCRVEAAAAGWVPL
jgi:hypothetical protein